MIFRVKNKIFNTSFIREVSRSSCDDSEFDGIYVTFSDGTVKYYPDLSFDDFKSQLFYEE